jgi:hypothetical protein
MANRFWWGQKGNERKIHWLSKKKLSKPKGEGGMGFRDLHLFNMALLARQGWRLLQQPDSLLYRILKAKYFPQSSLLEASVPCNASLIWKSIYASRDILGSGMRWRVGTGSRIRVWKDAWLPSPTSYKVISPIRNLDEDALVESLIHQDSMTWNVPLLEQTFLPRDVEIIQQIPLSLRRPVDRFIWAGTKKGVFTVKSAYQLQLAAQHRVRDLHQIRHLHLLAFGGLYGLHRCSLK